MKFGRPAGLFATSFGADNPRCQTIAAELNQPYTPSKDGYWKTLTRTSGDSVWRILSKSEVGYRDLSVEHTRADIYNDGAPVPVFRVLGLIHSREFTWLAAGRAGDPDPVSAAKRLLIDGAFDMSQTVPPGPICKHYPSEMAAVRATTEDLPSHSLFDLSILDGWTYVIQINAYEFADPDFLWVYSGHPDGSFSLDCVLDPKLQILKDPPDLHYE
jgi:hypothetical protein